MRDSVGGDFTTMARLLRFAVKDGYLQIVTKAAPFQNGVKNDATEYRFIARLPESWG
jgi:hypothetical protein